MTVRYSRDVSSSSFLCLYKLLFKWKGSIWKSVWSELLIWLVLYGSISATYRFWLTKGQREVFEDLCVFCDAYSGFIPITFMLGFYVQAVFGRWQKVFDNIGWIDMVAVAVATHVEGTSEAARNLRRNVVRHMVLLQAIIFRDISMRVKKRFPTLNHLVTAGFMTKDEMVYFENNPTPFPKYWQPLQWGYTSLKTAKDMGMISSDITYTHVLEKVSDFRNKVITLTFFDWVQVPLAYTQVVHIAVRSFFLLLVMGRQFLTPTRPIPGFKQPMDVIFPFVSCLQIAFIAGWIKVAEVMLNPLGEDDDDFETNWFLDRNLQVGLSMVDDEYMKLPRIERDAFWGDVVVEPLYTPDTCVIPNNPQIGSCVTLHPNDDGIMVRMRRRTLSGVEGVETDDEIVPVAGHEKKKIRSEGSFSKRLGSIVQRIRSRGKIDSRRPSSVEAPSTNETNATERRERASAEEARENETAATNQRRFTIISVPDLERLAEENGESRSGSGRNSR